MDQREQASSSSDFVQVLCLEEEIAALEQNIITAKEKLEHLESEFRITEKKKTETEAQITMIMKKVEEKDQELRQKIRLHMEKKDGLEKKCGDLDAGYARLSEDLNELFKTLQDKNDELKKVTDELIIAKREKRIVTKKRRFVSRAVMVSLIAVILFGWFFFNGEVSSWERMYDEVREQRNESLEKLSEIETYISPAVIKVNSVYNSGAGSFKISDDLKSSEMRYLQFDLNVYFSDDSIKEATIYLDIYKPDGSLDSSSNSPSGHTTSFDVKGTGNVDFGWGNSLYSTYPAGIYRVDFIYQGVIIHSQKVEIKSSRIKLS